MSPLPVSRCAASDVVQLSRARSIHRGSRSELAEYVTQSFQKIQLAVWRDKSKVVIRGQQSQIMAHT